MSILELPHHLFHLRANRTLKLRDALVEHKPLRVRLSILLALAEATQPGGLNPHGDWGNKGPVPEMCPPYRHFASVAVHANAAFPTLDMLSNACSQVGFQPLLASFCEFVPDTAMLRRRHHSY